MIKNVGQKRVVVRTRKGQIKWILVQIAVAKKTLASEGRFNDNGYGVVYPNGGGYIEGMSSGKVTKARSIRTRRLGRDFRASQSRKG